MTKKLKPAASDARFDRGHGDPTKIKTYSIKSYDFKSASDMPVRATGNYADNAMVDPSRLNEGDDGLLDRLQSMLHSAGVQDDEIKAGVELSPKGLQKVAAAFGIGAEQVSTLVNSLVTRVRRDLKAQDGGMALATESYDDSRYYYEGDFLGNVTVRDSETGDEVFLDGTEGITLMHSLDGLDPNSEYAQTILAAQFADEGQTQFHPNFLNHGGHDEALREEDEVPGEDKSFNFAAEINNDIGSFNFPWAAKGQKGTATVAYKGQDGKIAFKIMSVRDEAGEEIDAASFETAVLAQAKAFVGKE